MSFFTRVSFCMCGLQSEYNRICFSLSVFVLLACRPLQIEDVVTLIQDETEGVAIRTVKSFMTKIPSVVTGKREKMLKMGRPCTVQTVAHESKGGPEETISQSSWWIVFIGLVRQSSRSLE